MGKKRKIVFEDKTEANIERLWSGDEIKKLWSDEEMLKEWNKEDLIPDWR